MRFGLDLGGTKMEAILMDGNNAIIWRERRATPSDSYAAILDMIAELVAAARQESPTPISIGIGMPGSLSPTTGLVRNSNTVCLNGRSMKQDLEARLAQEIRFANDANCFALSEAKDGAGADAASVFGVILGTGCGGGLVFNGALHNGANGIGGEWGHNPLAAPTAAEMPGPACYCGRSGCNELWLSGSGFARDHEAMTGQRMTPPEIMASGTPEAAASFARLCDRLARALGAVINLADPEVIVLGGGLSNIDDIYTDVPALWDRYIFSDHVTTKLLKNSHGDSGGVRGAAWLWPSV